jgi:hypothetical protein
MVLHHVVTWSDIGKVPSYLSRAEVLHHCGAANSHVVKPRGFTGFCRDDDFTRYKLESLLAD